ncbi:MAG: MinD/ParA family protein, partial [Synergistaceae bacterium]|nr:MinD/ParA family protein [Synergistaceae bacterium]
TLLVTTPEPTSIRDAYGVIKSLGAAAWAGGVNGAGLLLVVNMATSSREAAEVAERIRLASMQFLGSAPIFLGYILKDNNIERAVRMRKMFYRLTPSCSAAACVRKITDEIIRLWEGRPVTPEPKGLKAFFAKLTRGLFKEK